MSKEHDVPCADTAEAKAAFYLRMRARGVRDTAVLRAFERVSRQDFVPSRYADMAARDLALPIGCGQTLDEPWLVARMIEALAVQPVHRVLQVGAGTGYATAILAQLAGEVMGLERYRSLAAAAQTRLAALAIGHAALVWGDGLALPPEAGRFDRILVHGVLAELPVSLMDRLAPDGVLVAARPSAEGQAVKRVTRHEAGFAEATICVCRLQLLQPGLGQQL